MRNRVDKIGLAVTLLYLLFVTVPGVAAQEWTTWAPAGEGFSVQLPLTPQEETAKVPILGREYLNKMYTAIDNPNRMMYLAVMQELPPVVGALKPAERLDNFMDGFRDGFVKELTATCPEIGLHQDRELTLKGRAGRQYSLTCKDIPAIIRVFETEQRMYVWLVMGLNENDDRVVRFLQSFEILPAPAPQPKTESKSPQD